MFDSSAMTDAGTLIAVTVLMIIIMFTFIGGLGYVIILRPRLRLRRRMTEFNLVARGAGKKNKAAILAKIKTISEPSATSLPFGHVTLKISCFTSCINFKGFIIIFTLSWQERRESNPQPPVLETGALPIELHS